MHRLHRLLAVWIERAAYHNHWSHVTPRAKAIFALAALVAAYAARTPSAALGVALVGVLVVWRGAGVPLRLYLRVAAGPLGFLLLSGASLLVSVAWEPGGTLAWRIAPHALSEVAMVTARSVAALSALLTLVLTTPLAHLMALLRQLRLPEILLDLMVLCYRLIFVFSESCHDTLAAQTARLGFSSYGRSMRSLGLLVGSLAAQVALRARGLQWAADARCSDGSLRFLTPHFAHVRRDTAIGVVAGLGLLLLARCLP